jgi:hypothetical protein
MNDRWSLNMLIIKRRVSVMLVLWWFLYCLCGSCACGRVLAV